MIEMNFVIELKSPLEVAICDRMQNAFGNGDFAKVNKMPYHMAICDGGKTPLDMAFSMIDFILLIDC